VREATAAERRCPWGCTRFSPAQPGVPRGAAPFLYDAAPWRTSRICRASTRMLARFAAGMAEEKDPRGFSRWRSSLQARCAELGRMARALEAAATPERAAGGEARRADRGAEATDRRADRGARPESPVRRRTARSAPGSRQMPAVEPRQVEAMAARERAASAPAGLRRAGQSGRRGRPRAGEAGRARSSPRPVGRSCGATHARDFPGER